MKKYMLLGVSVCLLLTTTAIAQDGTDGCTGPTPVTNGFYTFDTSTMTGSADMSQGACGTLDFHQDMFWMYVATVTGNVTIETFGSSFDTQLAVYYGASCNGVCIGQNDDVPGTLWSSVTFPAIAGDYFLVQIGGYGTEAGAGFMNISVDTPAPLNDDCAGANLLLGLGTYSFDPLAATTSGFTGSASCPGLVPYWQDVFFTWTAPSNGQFLFETMDSFLAYDSVMTLYWGNCNWTTCLAQDDDSGVNLASAITWPVSAGDVFLIQVSSFSEFEPLGPSSLSITLAPCQGSDDDDFEDNDSCQEASWIQDGRHSQLFISAGDNDFYLLCVPDGGTLTTDIWFSHAQADVDLNLWDAADPSCGVGTPLAGSYGITDSESLSWTNLSGADLPVILQAYVHAGACTVYDLRVVGSGCGSMGWAFCSPADSNSTGLPTQLRGWSNPGVGSGLHLEATSGPPTQFGYFLIGLAGLDPGMIISQGRLCLGAQIGRYNVAGGSQMSLGRFDGVGVLQNLAGTSVFGTGFDVPLAIPTIGGQILLGQTWYFQVWHREDGGESNFSNALAVTF